MVRGDPVDTRSDLYSVGVILYELLTGRLPFTHDRQDRLLAAHLQSAPPPFAMVGAAGVEPGVEAAVQLALAKYPNERPQTARDLVEMYGRGLGVDYWAETAPPGWEELEFAEPIHDPPPVGGAPDDPFRVTHEFEAAMPERLAAAKLRGFVEDLGGQVLASEPGLIRLRLGVPAGYSEKPPSGSGIVNWFRSVARPAVRRGEEPIELELYMDKPDLSQARLHVVAAFRPLKDYPPSSTRLWRDRCDRLNATLRQYLGA
jgi:serine/threonine protein kinase